MQTTCQLDWFGLLFTLLKLLKCSKNHNFKFLEIIADSLRNIYCRSITLGLHSIFFLRDGISHKETNISKGLKMAAIVHNTTSPRVAKRMGESRENLLGRKAKNAWPVKQATIWQSRYKTVDITKSSTTYLNSQTQLAYFRLLTGLYCNAVAYAWTAPSKSPAATKAAARLMYPSIKSGFNLTAWR